MSAHTLEEFMARRHAQPTVHPLLVGGASTRTARVQTQSTSDLAVTIETHNDSVAGEVRVNVEASGGPPNREPTFPFFVHANDLPALICCLIRGTAIAQRDGVIPALTPDGRKLVAALNEVLPA